MFVSHDHPSKKTFQKPNILRRKPKLPPIKVSTGLPPRDQAAAAATTVGSALQQSDILKTKAITVAKQRLQRLKPDLNVEKSFDSPSQENNVITILQGDYDGLECSSQDTVNVEPFLNGEQSAEYKAENELLQAKVEMEPKWHVDFLGDSEKVTIEPYDESQVYLEEKNSSITYILPVTTMTSIHEIPQVEDIQNVSIEHYSTRTTNFQCDTPDCNKQFLSEQKLKRHKNIHNKHNKTQRHTTSECPVRKTGEDGVEKPCGKIFLVREELLKHLNEDHTLDDAPHRCEECARRFFWAGGLRAHARAHRARRAPLACAWPGCGRAFRQPCRLREHARAHTGDRPYPCRHPNCGWSFRTASKLLRHARRHTGERRHACACGRAFLRREHLREHQARHAPHARAPRACPHAGCTHSFTNMSSLYLHMKKVHKKEEKEEPKTELSEISAIALTDEENTFMARAGAARTRCTWPLAHAPRRPAPRRPAPRRPAPRRPAPRRPAPLDDQVEQLENSESNIFTVRSDLFLHGNVLHNEDSQQMGETGAAGEPALAPASPLHADLGLLDTHSTIDLMQEELMYTDAAVDESSFQVLLLSGEELA